MSKPQTKTWLNQKIEIQEVGSKGKGMIAVNTLFKGETILVWGVNYTNAEGARKAKGMGKLIMQWDEDLFSIEERGEDEGYFINHSCNSNTWMKDAYSLESRGEILRGEEVTVDYGMWEADPSYISSWTCKCGLPECRGKATGNDWKIRELQIRYANHFSPLLNKWIRQQHENKPV